MSATQQLPMMREAACLSGIWAAEYEHDATEACETTEELIEEPAEESAPKVGIAFYRKHTEMLLRRYLYTSMQVGRSPSILGDAVGRGWVSSRPVKTFEDAVIFVLDVESCLDQLGWLDRALLSRIVLQDYTQVEAASLLGMSVRAVVYKLPEAVDHLTEKLLQSGLMEIPRS